MINFKDKIGSNYNPKPTKLHHLKKCLGGHAPELPSKAHGFAMRSMALCDMQISSSEKKNSCPPPNPGYAPEPTYF